MGDTIPYVICLVEEDMQKSYAFRAYHPDDLKKQGLKIDIDYYLNNQIHPPVARLLQPIEGTDGARIADCLGLDVSKFRSHSGSSNADDAYVTCDSTVSDEVRFKDAERLELTCTECAQKFEHTGIIRKTVSTF